MMSVVSLNHSFWREYDDKGPLVKGLSLFMDVSLILMAALISLAFVIEIDSICLIDQFTGERAELIAKSLQAEKDMLLGELHFFFDTCNDFFVPFGPGFAFDDIVVLALVMMFCSLIFSLLLIS